MFVSSGGTFIDENPVTEIVPGQVITLRTTKGTFRTRKLVITAGAWAPSLLSTLGLNLPLQVHGGIFVTSVLLWISGFSPFFLY